MDGSLAPLRHLRTTWLGLAALLLLGGCGRDDPAAPGLHTLRGHVVLVGQLVDGTGHFAGTRIVGDADGVTVELLGGTRVLARTTTVAGVYTFPNLAAGGYQVRASVIPPIRDVTLPLTITDTDIVAGDTLRLESVGELHPTPNPFSVETFVYFTLPDSERIQLAILDMAGDTIRTLLVGGRPAGQNQVRWDGLDRDLQPNTEPLVWVTFSTSSDSGLPDAVRDLRGHLLFHEPTTPQP